MLNEELIDKVIERLTRRIEQGNTYVLKQIGKSIKQIGTLSPSQAQQLAQIMRYGGDFDKIINRLAEITNLNEKDIYKIFDEIAKNDYNYAKKFYDYREKKFIPYEENIALKRQVQALASITAGEYRNLTQTMAFTKKVNGKVVYTPLARAYQDTLDKAVLSVSQGKITFQDQMYSTIKELANSGIKTVDYANGRSMRLDSAVRMQMKGALRNLHNEIQEQVGKEYDADGVEISVHMNPAPDHAEVQGRQFSNEEFDKFQNDIDAKDYKGKMFPSEFDGHDRRSISEYNCYHYTFAIVLGVSKPEYSDEELQQIINDTNKEIEFDGKKYNRYECTQLQRKLELEIRKQKDTQIIAKASGNNELILESQSKITQLTRKYKELSSISGLPTKMERMRVSGYRRTKVNVTKYTKDEKYAINKYISPYSIGFNEKLRKNIKLDDIDKNVKKNLDSALIKSSYYKGNIFRELEMKNPEEFINQLEIGKEFSTNQYLSFSTKKGYNEFANIKIYIENSEKSRDFRSFNSGELETLYERNKKFITENIVKKKGIYYILWKEKK